MKEKPSSPAASSSGSKDWEMRTTSTKVEDVVKRDKPVPCQHPSGAVIWVNLDEKAQNDLAEALRKKPAAKKQQSLKR